MVLNFLERNFLSTLKRTKLQPLYEFVIEMLFDIFVIYDILDSVVIHNNLSVIYLNHFRIWRLLWLKLLPAARTFLGFVLGHPALNTVVAKDSIITFVAHERLMDQTHAYFARNVIRYLIRNCVERVSVLSKRDFVHFKLLWYV